MAKAERLITADYNGLSNRPIINANLNDITLIPVANTYYRHVGNASATFTPGIIYKYDGTKFEEIGGSEPIDLSKYIQADTLAGLLPNVQYALVHNSDNVFTLVEVEGGEGGTGWLIATSDAEVEALLINDNIGKFFMFIGTSETYNNYSLYQIVVDDETITPALVFVSAEDIADALSDLETALEGKQDALVSGENIKTINNQSILGEGNLQIDGVTDYDDLDNIPIINADLASQEFVAVDGKYYRHTGVTGATFIAGMIYYAHNGAFIPITKDEDTNNYNLLSNIPIINQDLDAVGFVPVAGKYYKHVAGELPSAQFVDGTIYFYNGSAFKKVLVDGDLDLALSEKQDALVSGTNIKTINNESILGEGNIDIQGVSDYDELENTPIINQHEEREPAFVPFVTDETLLHNGDKIHFETDADSTTALVLALKTLGSGALVMASESLQLMCMVVDDDVYVAILDGGGVPTALYGTSAGEIEGLVFEQGWQNLDADGNFTITLAEDVLVELVGDSASEPLWNGTLISLVGEVVSIEPAPVNGKYYKRPDGDLYKYTEEITPAHLDAFTIEQAITNGTKIHFDTTKTQEEMLAFLQGLEYEGESDRFAMLLDSTNNGFVIAVGEEVVAENIPYIFTVGDEGADHIVYTTGAIPDSEITEAGWHNLDENGDLVLEMNEDDTISEINDTDPAAWNGVICGIFVEGIDVKTYDKVVLESELEEGGGLPDASDAKDGDALRVKVTPEVVAFTHPVELVTDGVTNDILINTNTTVDFSNFSMTEEVIDGALGQHLIKGDVKPIPYSYGDSISSCSLSIDFIDDWTKDLNGNSLADIFNSYWSYVESQSGILTDVYGYSYARLLRYTDSGATYDSEPLVLYKLQDSGTGNDMFVLYNNTSLQNNFSAYANSIWCNGSFTFDDGQGGTQSISQGCNYSEGIHVNNGSAQFAYDTNILQGFILKIAGTEYDLVAVSYEGASHMLFMLMSPYYGNEDYSMSEYGLVYSDAAMGEEFPAGWSPYLQYASGSQEGGIISYLRGFIPLALSNGTLYSVDELPNDITFVANLSYLQSLFGATRDVGVVVPAKKEIGWGLPFPDIKKPGQVLVSACDEYVWTYAYTSSHSGAPVEGSHGIYFNTDLDESTADSLVLTMSQGAQGDMLGVTAVPEYVAASVGWSPFYSLTAFEVGQTLGQENGFLLDPNQVEQLRSFLLNLGLDSSSPDYPLLIANDGSQEVNVIYARYASDKDRTGLYVGLNEVFNTDTQEIGSESMAGPLGVEGTVTSIAQGWNGTLIYSFAMSEDDYRNNAAMLGAVIDHNTEEFELYPLYCTGSGTIFVVFGEDTFKVFSNVVKGWNTDSFEHFIFSGMIMMQSVSSRFDGAESVYGQLVTLQEGLFYGDIANARVEWGDANSKVNPEDYETSYPGELYYLMGEGHQGEDLKRYDYSDVKSDISNYILNSGGLPKFYNGTIYLDQYSWSNQGTYWYYNYSFSYTLDDNDTLMIAPQSLADATVAQEANVYFAGHDNYSSQITFYASNQPSSSIYFNYSLIQRT